MDTIKMLYPTYYNPLLQKPARPLPEEMAVIGAGTIGPDIGYYLKTSLPNQRLYLVDIAEEPLKKAEKRFVSYTEKAVNRKKMKESVAKEILENVTYTTDYNDIKNCELVIEAATEDLALKQELFHKIEDIVSEDSIITSNTSSIPADQLFLKMRNHNRATVTHFFTPAMRNLAVEVINWEGVRREIVDYLFWFFAQTGKTPVITDNVICFMYNRVFENWCNEAAYLLEYATAAQIDSIAEEFVFGGPFFVLNLTNGNPIIFEINTRTMDEGEHYKPADILQSVEKWAVPLPGTKTRVPEGIREKIRDRLLGILFSQCFDIADRGIGTKEDLNFGCEIALGFKKGPFDMMLDMGEDEVNRITKHFLEVRPGFPEARQPIVSYQDFNRFLLVDEIDGVKIITIRRPQAMNALNVMIMNEIMEVFKTHSNNPSVKGFVITGYGNIAFSAGADLGRLNETLGNMNLAVQYAKDSSELPLLMDQMEKPVVAAVNGLAVSGGLEIATRCHGIIATENASFQFPEITLGIIPGLGGCIVPYRKWPQGAQVFNEMIFLAKPISAQQSADIGMVTKITHEYSELVNEAVKEVLKLGRGVKRAPDGKIQIPDIILPDIPKGPGNLELSKEVISIAVKTIQKGAGAEFFSNALEVGYQGAGEASCTDAAKEGFSAFKEKRRPVFER